MACFHNYIELTIGNLNLHIIDCRPLRRNTFFLPINNNNLNLKPFYIIILRCN